MATCVKWADKAARAGVCPGWMAWKVMCLARTMRCSSPRLPVAEGPPRICSLQDRSTVRVSGALGAVAGAARLALAGPLVVARARWQFVVE